MQRLMDQVEWEAGTMQGAGLHKIRESSDFAEVLKSSAEGDFLMATEFTPVCFSFLVCNVESCKDTKTLNLVGGMY